MFVNGQHFMQDGEHAGAFAGTVLRSRWPVLRHDKATRIYAATVASLDDSVGRIIDKLKEVGQYENTLIVFLSDDGWAAYIGDGVCSSALNPGP